MSIFYKIITILIIIIIIIIIIIKKSTLKGRTSPGLTKRNFKQVGFDGPYRQDPFKVDPC